MSEQISLTLPLTHSALTRAAEMLSSLAVDLDTVFTREEIKESTVETIVIPDTSTDGETIASAKEVFGESPAGPAGPASPEVTPETAAATFTTPEGEKVELLVGVEVDSAGLPWDVRIHAGSKAKLAKTQLWRMKRNVAPALVTEVEAELRQARAIPAASTTQAPATTPAGPADTVETPVADTVEVIDTFPKLMAAITANGIDQATVQAAVAAVGLASLPLVATRPDLIPQVAAGLGI